MFLAHLFSLISPFKTSDSKTQCRLSSPDPPKVTGADGGKIVIHTGIRIVSSLIFLEKILTGNLHIKDNGVLFS